MSFMSPIQELASRLIPPESDSQDRGMKHLPDWVDPEYLELLSLCEGGYAENCFFHFFGLSGPVCHNVMEWNAPSLWKNEFPLENPGFVFAEDIFGNQFVFTSGRRKVIKTLWIEEGAMDLAAGTFGDFVRDLVFNRNTLRIARELAAQFLLEHEDTFKEYLHIAYKTPLCLGGSVDINNMEYMPSVQHVRMCGQIISQVKQLPVGTRITGIDRDTNMGNIRLIVN